MKLREALQARITAYLSGGGLFNPELANHDAVRDLLIECRDALAEPVADEPVRHLSTDEQAAMKRALFRSARPAASPAERGEYPPLPTSLFRFNPAPYASAVMHAPAPMVDGYTADQMRAYVDADRAQRVPLTEAEIVSCLASVARSVPKGLTYDSGPYDITKPTAFLVQLVRAVERAHKIGVKP